MKRDYKNLSSKEYIENLSQYLGDVRSKKILTTEDLRILLIKLNSPDAEEIGFVELNDDLVTSSVSSDYDHSKVYGPYEHVAAVDK